MITWSLAANCHLNPTIKPTKCSVRVMNAMHHGKFHKSHGNVISMADDEKAIMVIFQFQKMAFSSFDVHTYDWTAKYLENKVLKRMMLF